MAAEEGVRCVQGHTVMIHDRGGQTRQHQLTDLTSVSWGRVRSQKGQAVVTLSGRACQEQASTINKIASAVRRYEVVIFRGADRVFEGPLIQASTRRDSATFIANDVKEYLDATPLTKDWPNPDGGGPPLMTDRIQEIIDYEMTTPYQARIRTGGAATVVTIPRWEGITPPANVLPYIDVQPSTTLLTRSNTLAFQMMLGDHLDNLAENSLDYTTVGRSLIIWDSSTALGRTRKVTDADFYGDIEVIAAGTDHAVIGHVSAQRPEEPGEGSEGVVPGVGNAGEADDYYGVWTRLHSLEQEEGSDTPTQDGLNSQASRAISGRSPVPTEIRVPDGASLRLSAGLTINMLVPGVILPVQATLNLRPVSQDQILDKITVTETAEGESIAVTLISAGDVTSISQSSRAPL